MRRWALLVGVALAVAPVTAIPANAATGSLRITFEDMPAPCVFPKTHPLAERYADVGVHFSGVGAPGGMVLKQCGGFGIPARSGVKLLAFNASFPDTGLSERIAFDRPQTAVLLYAADPRKGAGETTTFTLVGYRAGAEVARTVVSTTGVDWTPVRVSDPGGLDEVVLTAAPAESGTFVVDDVVLTPGG